MLLIILPIYNCAEAEDEANGKYPAVVFIQWQYFENYDYKRISALTLIETRNSHWVIIDDNGNQPSVNNYPGQNITIMQSTLEKIPGNLMSDFLQIMKLHANNSNINSIDKNDFKEANFLKILDLSHNKISKLPEHVFVYATQLQVINLSYNEITEINRNAFLIYQSPETLALREIYLNNNKIAFIIDGTSFGDLEILSLHNNLLTEYSPVNYIADLRLDENALVSFDTSFGHRLINLTNTSIESFAILPSTIAIHADNCKLNVIIIIPLENYQLETLRVANNLLTSISTFAYLQNLEILDVSHNLLDEIDTSIFNNYTKLQELNLSHNQLIIIDQQFLPHATYLTHLNIGYNQLEQFYLEQRAENLRSLRIEGNGLTTIDSNLRQLAPALQFVGLDDNNFTCQHLTVSLLLLHYDGISQITSGLPAVQGVEGNSTVWGFVKGVRCINPMENYNEIISSNSPPPKIRNANDNDALKEEIMSAMDSKIDHLEEKTVKMVNSKFEELEQSMLNLFFIKVQGNSTN